MFMRLCWVENLTKVYFPLFYNNLCSSLNNAIHVIHNFKIYLILINFSSGKSYLIDLPWLIFTGGLYAISVPDFYRHVKNLNKTAPVPGITTQYKRLANITCNAAGVCQLFKSVQAFYDILNISILDSESYFISLQNNLCGLRAFKVEFTVFWILIKVYVRMLVICRSCISGTSIDRCVNVFASYQECWPRSDGSSRVCRYQQGWSERYLHGQLWWHCHSFGWGDHAQNMVCAIPRLQDIQVWDHS